MKMNKREFIKALSGKTGLSLEDTSIVNQILEENFFLRCKNKDKIVSEIVRSLNISKDEAVNLYEEAKTIFNEEVRYRFKHSFQSKD